MSKAKSFFQLRKTGAVPSFNIATIMRNKDTKGDVGIEIEVEGNKFPVSADDPNGEQDAHLIPKVWVHHYDGSLRGKHNAEYVTRGAISFDDVPAALSDLWKMFSDYGSVLDDSNRTSVHVHLNAQGWYLNRLTSFLAMYFCLEEILTQWCGDHRVGNLFCLRAKDATGIVSKLAKFIASDGKIYPSEGLHYAGLNCHSLTKFGSVEVRSLRGVNDPKVIETWVGILRRLYDLSAEYEDPRKVIEGFSGEGAFAYLERLLGPYTSEIVTGSGYNHQRISEAMLEGIRLAQELCYCRDWSNFSKAEVRSDPFGRSKAKTMASLQSASETAQSLDSSWTLEQAPTYTTGLMSTQSLSSILMNGPTPPDSNAVLDEIYDELYNYDED